jgi:hypothetical protein
VIGSAAYEMGSALHAWGGRTDEVRNGGTS